MKTADELRAAAGLIRVLVGVLVITVLGAIYPGIASARGVFCLYVLSALAFEALIMLRVGDRMRAIVGGLVDMAMLTFAVHRIGSASTFLVSMYVFACVINALVVGRTVAFLLAGAGSTMYGGVLAAEALGVVPYASSTRTLEADEAFVTWMIVTALLVTTSAITGGLVRAIREREMELRRANARLADLSQRDPLTDLWNRRRLLAELEAALVREESGVAIAAIDLDRFKAVNDRLGHLQGDALLCALASAFTLALGARDEVCRFGGDEFVVLLRGPVHEARDRSERLVHATRTTAREFHPDCHVTASVGFAVARDGEGSEELLRRADELAYDAKRGGGDRLVHDGDEELPMPRAAGMRR